MPQRVSNRLGDLLGNHEPPCISIYQATRGGSPGGEGDQVRFRQLLAEAEASLRRKYPVQEARALLDRLEPLAADDAFWRLRPQGHAVFCSPDALQVVDLLRPVREFVVVADSFHVKPLLRFFQSADHFHVLCLSGARARLYEGNRYGLSEVEPRHFPATPGLAAEATLSGSNVYHPAPTAPGPGPGRADEVDVDRETFFRLVDRGVWEYHSQPTGASLVLAALSENQGTFRSVSRNAHLLGQGIPGNPDALTPDELRQAAWAVLEPHYLERLQRIKEDFGTARARGKGSDDVAEVAGAALQGRVGRLLVEADREIPGRIDPDGGGFRAGRLDDPDVDDALDDIAEHVLRRDGEVIVVPGERMPTRTGLAAVYRY